MLLFFMATPGPVFVYTLMKTSYVAFKQGACKFYMTCGLNKFKSFTAYR